MTDQDDLDEFFGLVNKGEKERQKYEAEYKITKEMYDAAKRIVNEIRDKAGIRSIRPDEQEYLQENMLVVRLYEHQEFTGEVISPEEYKRRSDIEAG